MRQHWRLYSLRGFLPSDRREAKEILQGRFVGAALRQPAEVDFAALRKTVQLCHASERTVLLGAVVSPAWLSISEPEKRELHVCPFCQADNATWHPMVYERPQNPQALTTRHANPWVARFAWPLLSASVAEHEGLLRAMGAVVRRLWQQRHPAAYGAEVSTVALRSFICSQGSLRSRLLWVAKTIIQKILQSRPSNQRAITAANSHTRPTQKSVDKRFARGSACAAKDLWFQAAPSSTSCLPPLLPLLSVLCLHAVRVQGHRHVQPAIYRVLLEPHIARVQDAAAPLWQPLACSDNLRRPACCGPGGRDGRGPTSGWLNQVAPLSRK